MANFTKKRKPRGRVARVKCMYSTIDKNGCVCYNKYDSLEGNDLVMAQEMTECWELDPEDSREAAWMLSLKIIQLLQTASLQNA